MGGKSSNSNQQVQIPPAVLAQYQAVNAMATQTANTPFQKYGGEFVAPVQPNQQVGINSTMQNAQQAQPYFQQATSGLGATQSAADAANAGASQTLNNAQANTAGYNQGAATTLASGVANTAGYNQGAVQQLSQAQGNTTGANQAATGLAAASAQQVNASPLGAQQIDQYLSPYLNTVLGSESALLNQNNQEQQAGQLGTAISSGAFGGDRTGLAAANLEQQQNLSNANIYSGILNTGYNNALSTAQQQQGVGLAAGQANRAALGAAGEELAGIGQTAYGEQAATANSLAGMGQTAFGEANTAAQTAAGLGQTAYGEASNTAAQQAAIGNQAYQQGANTATTLAGLGTGAQTANLQGAQAEIGAGTLQQQTMQALDTANYNQFLQQQSYPFQVDQFLANIAEGTGALSGSNTTTTQPGGFFSDRRLKTNIKKIGKTFDGQPIYSYGMHGDPRTHIGLIAQEVEKSHPEAVGVAGHYKVVDYGKATDSAANRGHFYTGGVVPARHRFAAGGNPSPQYAGMPSSVSPQDLSAILAAQEAMYAPFSGGTGTYGSTSSAPYGGMGHVPPPSGAVSHLVTAQGGLRPQQTGLQNASQLSGLVKQGQDIAAQYTKSANAKADAERAAIPSTAGDPGPVAGLDPGASPGANATPVEGGQQIASTDLGTTTDFGAKRGGRQGLAVGGGPYSDAAAAGSTTIGIPTGTAGHSAFFGNGGVAGRHGYDSGGEPYGGGAGGLDIPDTAPAQHQLQTAGPLAPQKSGLSSLMGDVGQVAGIAAMFMNRGGVAGRKGYAGGGRPDFDGSAEADQQDLNLDQGPPAPTGPATEATGDSFADQVVEGKKDKGLSAVPTPAPVAPKATQTEPVASAGAGKPDHWWSKPENVVPLLTGLAAMGTAPTRSLGVALSAGLGAGAQSWLPAQSQAAGVQTQQLENKGLGMQNDLTAYQLDQIKHPPPVDAPRPAPTPGIKSLGVSVDPASIRQTAQQIGQVQDTYTPNEALAIQQASMLQKAGKPNNLQALLTQHRTRLQTEQQGASFAMNGAYQDADLIANAGKGQYFSTLQQVHPDAAANIQGIMARPGFQAKFPGVTADDLAYAYADQVGGATHQYANRGDPKADNDGKMRDARSGHLILGGAVPVGASPDTLVHARLALADPVNTGAVAHPALGNTPAGAAAAQALGLGRGAPGAAPLAATGLGAGSQPSAAPAPAAPAIPSPAPVAPRATRPAAQQDLIDSLKNPATAGAYTAGNSPPARPAEQQRLIDRLHGKISAPPAAASAGTTAAGPTPLNYDAARNKPPWAFNVNAPQPEGSEDYNKTYWELRNEANGIRGTNAQLVNVDRMQHELENARTGPLTDKLSAIQTTLGNLTGDQLSEMFKSNPASWDLLAKGTGNNALDTTLHNIHEGGGASVRLGPTETNLILNRLSASPEMATGAVRTLLGWQKQQLQYEAERQNSIPDYLDKYGKDPTVFDNWYANQRPLSRFVSVSPLPETRIQGTPSQQNISQADYAALPSGATYTWNGKSKTKK